MGRWFPENHDQYQVFSREYYWSPAYHYFDDPYYGRNHWEEIYEKRELPVKSTKDSKNTSKLEIEETEDGFQIYLAKSREDMKSTMNLVDNLPEEKFIGEVMVTTESHMWESGTGDEEKPSYFAPRELMYEKMQLQYSKNIGEWLNAVGEVVCFDPSVNQNTSSCLLVRKDALLKFLDENNLKIFWTCLGKKQILGGHHFNKSDISEWLELSGVFTLSSNRVDGDITLHPRSTR